MALSFLLEGAKVGERGLYVTFSETEQELRTGAQSHGWDLDDKIDIFEIVPPESLLDSSQQQSLLYSSDLELGETTKLIFDAVERTKAQRVVVDSLSEIRLLAQELAALSSADPGAEALFRPSRLHRVAARRSHGRPARQDGAQRCRRRRPAGGDVARLRRRAAARPRHQISRPGLPRRLPRLRHPAWRRPYLPAAGRGRAPPRFQAQTHRQRHSRPGHACWVAASSAVRAPC